MCKNSDYDCNNYVTDRTFCNKCMEDGYCTNMSDPESENDFYFE